MSAFTKAAGDQIGRVCKIPAPRHLPTPPARWTLSLQFPPPLCLGIISSASLTARIPPAPKLSASLAAHSLLPRLQRRRIPCCFSARTFR